MIVIIVPLAVAFLTSFLVYLACSIGEDIRHARTRSSRRENRPGCDLREAALREYPEFGGTGKQAPPAAAPRGRDCRCRECRIARRNLYLSKRGGRS